MIIGSIFSVLMYDKYDEYNIKISTVGTLPFKFKFNNLLFEEKYVNQQTKHSTVVKK